jgi:DNA repair protein RadD
MQESLVAGLESEKSSSNIVNELVLRNYQEDAIILIKNSLANGNKRIVLQAATGSGKSAICETMIVGALKKGKRVMFLVNRVQLADQMSTHLSRAKIEHGILQGANTRGTYHDCVIASIDTIHKRGYPECDLILCDEVHGAAGSEKYHKLIEHYKGIPIIGVTATCMAKGLGKQYKFGKLFEDIVCPISIQELIDQGYLVDVDIYAPSEPDLKNVKIVAGDYHEKQLAEAVDKPTLIGDIVDNWMQNAKGKQTIVFAVDIAHSKHIVERFNAAGINAEHIDYMMTYDEKKEIVGRFKASEFTILSNCALLSEGFDAPATEVMILARPTKSKIRYLQMVGRVLRPFAGKDKAVLFDHSGSTAQLGFPTDDFPIVLDDGKPKKSSGSDKKKEEKLPVKCTSCKYLRKNGGKCPICGFVPQKKNSVVTAIGSLTKKEKTKKSIYESMNKQQVFSELRYIANEKGYSDGWVANQYRSFFSVWPRGLENTMSEPGILVHNKVKSNFIRFAKGRKNG